MLQFSMFLLIYSVMSLDREYFMCTDLVASGLFLLYSYLYTVMMTIFGGGGGESWTFCGEASTPQIS